MSNQDAIERFAKKLQNIPDINMGDYRRKAQTYLNRLKQELGQCPKELGLEILRMEDLISYSYPEDLHKLIGQIEDSTEKIRHI